MAVGILQGFEFGRERGDDPNTAGRSPEPRATTSESKRANVKILVTAIISVVVTLLIAGAMMARSGKTGLLGKDSPATPVRLEQVGRGNLIESVSATGQIQPKTKVQISARVAARVVELPHPMGSVVTKGNPAADPPVPASVLVRLDSKDLEANLRSVEARYAASEANIKVAEAQLMAQEAQISASRVTLAEAERDLRRQKELLASRDVSQATVDEAQSRVDELRAQLSAAEHRLSADRANLVVLKHNLDAADAEIARARDNLSYAIITSPIDGVVTKVNAEVGELVVTGTMNNAGTVILEVADLSRMLMNAKVDESVVASLKVGQRAVVRIPAYRTEVFEGTVDTIALAHTEEKDGSRYFKTEILLDTDQGRRIYSGLNADADIEVRRHEDVLTVPSQAVLGRPVDGLPIDLRSRPEVDQDKTYTTVVYRHVDGKAVVTPVRIGASDVTRTVIESGLSREDVVIVGPYKVLESLQHDQKVIDEKKAATQPSATQPAPIAKV